MIHNLTFKDIVVESKGEILDKHKEKQEESVRESGQDKSSQEAERTT